MGCCKNSNTIFNHKYSFDKKAVERVLSDARDESPPILQKQIENPSILSSVSNNQKSSSSFSSKIQNDADLSPCEYRISKGTASIGSRSIAVYDCTHFGFAVHKGHCLKCPLKK